MTKQQFGFISFILLTGLCIDASPSGMLAEKFGPRKMISIALLWWSAFTILTGMIKHHGLLYLVRFLFGIGEAPMYPSNAVFNSTWFAKDEKESIECVVSRIIFRSSISTSSYHRNC